MTDRDRRTEITPELQTYMIEHGARQDELLQRVERETHELGGAAELADLLRPLLALPIELVLVSHGKPVLRRGRSALERALAQAPSAA